MRYGLNRFILTDQPLVQGRLHAQELLAITLKHFSHGYARPSRNELGNFQGLYLVVYLGIRLLPLLASLALEKLFSVSPLSRTSWILILMGIVYILTLKPLLTSLLSQVVGST